MNQTRATIHPIDYILERLCINLQISDSLYGSAEESYKAVGNWLAEKSDLAANKPAIYPQVSLKIGTTIKPIGNEEYDLDMICEFGNVNSMINPKELLNAVYQTIKSNSNYSDIAELKKRCVRINYKRQFHLDIVPAMPNTNDTGTCIFIPDKQENGGVGVWIPTNPKGYANWFEERCKIPRDILNKAAKLEHLPENEPFYDKPPLKRVVQLLKRWRNNVYKDIIEQAPVSIVLTTLAAEHYKNEINLSDAMTTILNSINERNKNGYYEVNNPTTSSPMELLSEKWKKNPECFNHFVIAFGSLTRMWNELKNDRGTVLENRLTLMFGNTDGLVKKAYMDYNNTITEMRKSESLSMSKSGILSTLGGGVKVRPNTFHGD